MSLDFKTFWEYFSSLFLVDFWLESTVAREKSSVGFQSFEMR